MGLWGPQNSRNLSLTLIYGTQANISFRTVLKRNFFRHWQDGKPAKNLENGNTFAYIVFQVICVKRDVETCFNGNTPSVCFKTRAMLCVWMLCKVVWKMAKYLEMEMYLSSMLCVWMLCKWFVLRKMCSGYQLSDSDPTSVTDMAPKVHTDIHMCVQTHTHTHTAIPTCNRGPKLMWLQSTHKQ